MANSYKKIEGNIYLAAFSITVNFTLVAMATIAVLLMMDAMECFLHTLRLHWVEFQSKFYKGEGIPYHAFTFDPEEAEASINSAKQHAKS